MTVDLPVARDIATSFVGAAKAMSAHKRKLPRPHPHADHGALPLLYALEAEPLRVSALADIVHSDVSTVSRQVSALTDGGRVTKICDPQDGRAQLVTLTPDARELVSTLREDRAAWMQNLLTDWSTAEAREFQHLLLKFTASLDAYQGGCTPRAGQPTHLRPPA